MARTQPTIDWKQRVLRVERNGKVFEIKTLAIADSYRMTCPVVRVAKVGEGEAEAEQVVADAEKWWGPLSNLHSLVVVEEVMPTLEDQQMVSRGVDAK